MSDDEKIQIVAVMPGGGFESVGLIKLSNVDTLIGLMASPDTRGGRPIRTLDLFVAHSTAAALAARAARDNNDADDDGV